MQITSLPSKLLLNSEYFCIPIINVSAAFLPTPRTTTPISAYTDKSLVVLMEMFLPPEFELCWRAEARAKTHTTWWTWTWRFVCFLSQFALVNVWMTTKLLLYKRFFLSSINIMKKATTALMFQTLSQHNVL